LALADEDFPAARKALGDLAETQPTARSLAIMAALERGSRSPTRISRPPARRWGIWPRPSPRRAASPSWR
ncbi:hypothetical protein CNY89_30355, partial [Amaricoccus sp. HAR-UPW-R2A-40]